MKKQVYNPFLPKNEYISDGEPHVFGDRVYLYGSHDREAGESYCMDPYVIWSAPINDLSDWSNNGISYQAKQDPLYSEARPHMYAPDCVRGHDGRYYLYYELAGLRGNGGYNGPISVAVCDTPDGKFEYYGVVSNPDGTPFNDMVLFDPAVINDEGEIRLYFGACYPFSNFPKFMQRMIFDKVQMAMFSRTKEEVSSENGVMGAYTLTLEKDMLTVKTAPRRLIPTKTKNTQWEKNPFYEGSSIRKIMDTYYFIYSSLQNHELCYATSKFPDREFTFRGVIVSNGDVGYMGRQAKDRLNHTGTNHGSIEQIDGKWYVFYHRQTHGTDYSRQACAQEIQILEDGSIPQVEITSCGLNGGPLLPQKNISAIVCCNLTNGKMPHGSNKKVKGIPMIGSSDGEQFVTGVGKNCKVVYKYFKFSKEMMLHVTARGKGKLLIHGEKIRVESLNWTTYSCPIRAMDSELLCFEGITGNMDILSFSLMEC